jgi:hypothetical protein
MQPSSKNCVECDRDLNEIERKLVEIQALLEQTNQAVFGLAQLVAKQAEE